MKIKICMYVRTYVRMYVCMLYVCIYACMHACSHCLHKIITIRLNWVSVKFHESDVLLFQSIGIVCIWYLILRFRKTESWTSLLPLKSRMIFSLRLLYLFASKKQPKNLIMHNLSYCVFVFSSICVSFQNFISNANPEIGSGSTREIPVDMLNKRTNMITRMLPKELQTWWKSPPCFRVDNPLVNGSPLVM